jgi:4-hydroxy-tetrahydrodipicolinate synthase
MKGTGVALVTPFKDQKIDFPALEKIIEHVLSGGVDFIVSLGTTGEAATLSDEEKREVLDFTIEKVNGRKPIVAGIFGHNNTAELIRRVEKFRFEGIHAIMSASPAYNKPPQEGIYQHYMKLAEASPLPIIIYNVPGRTSSNVEAETTLRLAHASDKFLAVKEASADMVQAMHILKNKPDHFRVLSGDDPTALPLVGCGGDGVISVIANAFPTEFSGMIRAALNRDLKEARHLNDLLLDIHPWLYIDGNPAGVKSLLYFMGLCSPEVRLPLAQMQPEHLSRLKEEMEKITARRYV